MMNAHISKPVEPIRELSPGTYVPSGLDKAILKALSKNPDDRFQSMKEFAKAIEASFSGAPDVVMPSAVRTKISSPGNAIVAGAELRASSEVSARKKKKSQANVVLITVAIWVGVIGILALGVIFGLSLHKGGDTTVGKTASTGSESESPGDGNLPASNSTAVNPNNNGTVVSGNTINVGPAVLPGEPPKLPPGKLPPSILPPLPSANGKSAGTPGLLPLPVPPGAANNQNANGGPIVFSSNGGLPPLPPTQITSIISRGNSAGFSAEQMKEQGIAAFDSGNYQEALDKLSGLSDAESNSAILGRLYLAASKRNDPRAQDYLNKFKNRNRFTLSSEIRDNLELLRLVYAASGQPSSSDDYEYAENMLKGIIDAAARKDHGRWQQAVLDLNHIYHLQHKISEADRLLNDAIAEGSSEDAATFKQYLTPAAAGPMSGPMGGPMGGPGGMGGPMGGQGGQGGPGGMGGPMGGPMGGRGPMGGGGMGGPQGGPGGMGGRFGGGPGQDGGG